MAEFIPLEKREGYIWVNGEVKPWKEVHFHVLNHGLHYANSVFEGLRVYGGKAFKLEAHMCRFHRSASYLDFEIPYSLDVLCDAVRDIIKRQSMTEGYVRPVAFGGSESLQVYSKQTKTHVAIAAWEWPVDRVEKRVSLVRAHWQKPSPTMMPVESKAACLYTIATMAKRKAVEKGYDDALLLDHEGFIAEATTSNFFMVKDNALHTPSLGSILPGITRQTIIDIARKEQIQVHERKITFDEIRNAQEVFLTGTAAEVTSVERIEDMFFPSDAITSFLKTCYKKCVEL